MYSLTAKPLPQPPAATLDNEIRKGTIHDHLDLFKITCNINVDALKNLLSHHPNQPFVQSVLTGLRHRFWPFANTVREQYPKTWDVLSCTVRTEVECEFLAVQVDIEVKAGRFSPSFGTELFPGMYSPPVHTILKPGIDTFRLVVDHSSSKFGLNMRISLVFTWMEFTHLECQSSSIMPITIVQNSSSSNWTSLLHTRNCPSTPFSKSFKSSQSMASDMSIETTTLVGEPPKSCGNHSCQLSCGS